ncbi:polyketide synthase PksJ [Aquimarina sp. EL_43]|uniref:beta-ketoacyl synthase N-terminal-like domain-containing protein n=1 Tax=unclassified Aquimarina TaxID=2627091 RepID=UPI0018C96F9C|nr:MULTISPECIES: beta-ketoacyl synthase N-terminal-like domain-containing protein [unclassified Aquimarina]MBG6133704.1 polyketide synthase PksJ [Aquimarina sp. EL_35]MBG6153875.1 polyketide synthase PksJ [Aquimarina sp. EL_32]MBG6172075.1 polyketide synthase PksJ [Aquimarina sp. EL_43]
MTVAITQNVLQEIITIFETTLRLPAGKLDPNANFEDFGIDSIISMELINKISRKFNITLSPSKFVNVNTTQELADLLEEEIISVKTDDIDNVPETNNSPEIQIKSAVKSPATEKNINSNSTRDRTSRGRRSVKESYHKLLHFIDQKYKIDLSHLSFTSIDEIVDVLLSHHSDDLMQYYNNFDQSNENDFNGKEKQMPIANVPAKPSSQNCDIAIVGLSCNFPDAPNIQTFWENLVDGKNSINEISKSRWNWEDYYEESVSPGKTISKWGAMINDIDCFDPKFFDLDPEEAILMDPQERLLIQEVYKAFQDAGVAPKKLAGSDTAIYVAYEYSEYENYLRKNIDKIPVGKYGPVFSSSSPTYYLANRLSFLFDFYGPSESINVNCAGSAVAINRAYYSLLNNECSTAVVGGVSLNLFEDDYISLSQYGMLSPTGTCGVFDDEANGFTRGEGVAAVVLKRLDDAKKDNNRIYGVIKTSHQNNRGNARFLSEVKHEAITNVITNCYQKASITPESINYIEVDGYATKWGDSFEYEGIKNVFREHKSKEKECALGSVKGNIGNLEAVSGLASFIKLALSLYHKKFPMTISGKKINTFIDIDNTSHPLYIANKELPFDILREHNDTPIRAGLNSFADSGVNLHIVLEEYPIKAPISKIETTTSSQLFVLSAKDGERLDQYIDNYIDYLSNTKTDSSLEDLIYTLQVGRDAMDERLSIVVSSHTDLLEKLIMIKNSGKETSLEKEGIFYGNINRNKENGIIKILTKDMISTMVEQSLKAAKWEQLAQLWTSGLHIDWIMVWKNKKVHPVSLPDYPFAKERYWVDIDDIEKLDSKEKPPVSKSIKNNEIQVINENPVQAEWFFFRSDNGGEINLMKPTEKIKLFLKHEIALQIKKPIEKISEDSNFLDLGMNSIGLITMIAQVNDLLEINISPAILFNNSEIKTLTQYVVENHLEKVEKIQVTNDKEHKSKSISEKESKSNESTPGLMRKTLVPMQVKGKKRPVFAVPGADGNIITLQHLISALGIKQPFYGLEPVGITKENTTLDSVEAIAKANIEAIKEVQSTGPYRLLGFSNGGTIAYEMARILLDQKETIEALILVDCMSPTIVGGHMIDDLVEGIKSIFINASGQNVILDAEQLKQVPENEIVDYIYDNVKNLGFNFPKEQLATSIYTTIANDKYCRAYTPIKLPEEIEILLFKATDGYMDAYKNAPEDYGWNALLHKPILIDPIEANHFSIIDKNNSKKIAKKINAFFNKTTSKKSTVKQKVLQKH